jgi:hypothetical protein
MGRDLVLLKQTKPPGIEWGIYLKELGIEFSREYADRLIRRVEPKKPIERKPAPEPSSEPEIEIVDEFPDRKTLKPADRKTLYEEGCALLERMDPPTRRKFFAYQERKYLADFEGAVDALKRQIEGLESENAKLRQKLDPGRCGWVNDDGGRAAAGHEPQGDCVVRAISVATERPYAEVREALKATAVRYARRYPESYAAEEIRRSRNGAYNHLPAYRGYLRSLGWKYTVPKERIYLRADMLPPGRLVVLVNCHAVAVIDGVIYDTFDCGKGGRKQVEGFWSAPSPGCSKPEEAHDNGRAPEATAAIMKSTIASIDSAEPTVEAAPAAVVEATLQTMVAREPGLDCGELPDCLRRVDGVRQMRRPEQSVHRTIVAHLNSRAVKNLFWFHVPSGAFFGGKRQGAIMKSLGWRAGLPDLLLIHEGKTYALELKMPGRPLTPAQEEVLVKLRECGARACHVHGLDQALACLERWGLLREVAQ